MLRFDVVSHLIEGESAGAAFRHWKVQYSLHEYFGKKAGPLTRPSHHLFPRSSTSSRQQGTHEEDIAARSARTRGMFSLKKHADGLHSFDLFQDGITVSFDAEKQENKEAADLLYFPSAIYHSEDGPSTCVFDLPSAHTPSWSTCVAPPSVPLFRHPGGLLRSMVMPITVVNVATLFTMVMDKHKYEDKIATHSWRSFSRCSPS
eukprot:3821394-Prymnesium_polylepis.2